MKEHSSLKIRRTIFPILVALVLISPAALFCAQKVAHLSLPSWLTTEEAKYLSGTTSEVDVRATATLAGFESGKFQTALETEIGNFIPAKAGALLGNAALQRTAIAVSNSLFGWECYPTQYAGNILYIPDADALTAYPRTKSAEWEDRWRSFADGVREAAIRYPDKRFVLYVVGAYSEPAYDLAYELVSDPMVPTDCCDILRESTEGLSNVDVLTNSYSNAEEYYEDFFRTDHHWNIQGAFRAYKTMAERLELETVSMDDTWDIPDYSFSGSRARWGLDMLGENVFDCGNSFNELSIYDGDVLIGSCANHDSFFDAPYPGKRFQFYDKYYDNIGNYTIKGGSGERHALLIGNSFRGAIQRPLASSYSYLALSNQLHPSSKPSPTLAEQIESSQADDIIFVANPGNYSVSSSFWGM